MAEHKQSRATGRDAPVEVFRQFAWHLAGSLGAGRARSEAAGTVAKPQPAKAGAKR